MKVWELIRDLEPLPANTKVLVNIAGALDTEAYGIEIPDEGLVRINCESAELCDYTDSSFSIMSDEVNDHIKELKKQISTED